MARRNIEQCQVLQTSISMEELDPIDIWLEYQANEFEFEFLLAHADDGVIWGKMVGEGPTPGFLRSLLGQKLTKNTLVTSAMAAEGHPDAEGISPLLRIETLQQVRLFGKSGELLLWRNGDNAWENRVILENKANSHDVAYFDESQILWGTHAELLEPYGFALMSDGIQGLRHIVPIRLSGDYEMNQRPLRLHVRHYLQEDEIGFVHIVTSRLVKIGQKEI